MTNQYLADDHNRIAIIGMAGRFPGAANIEAFRRNIRDGVESISRFNVSELENADANEAAKDPRYVRARAILENADLFDADFFGILPKEAERIDPQHRVFLENCWEALEEAGYDPQTYRGLIAVFAGCSANTYFLRNLCTDREFIEDYTSAYQIGHYPTLLGTNHDFLATRVSYKLNLKGPSYTLQCGCSTSLVAVTQACQSLLAYQCDMALAGGVSITFPQKRGYLHQEGGMGSIDGHCRSFDAEAQGTVFGSGSAVVLLKRLEDAINDGDHIHAVVRASAVNNDGALKLGYTAPSVEGQAQVVAMALALSGIDPTSIQYLEAHGTATPMGDPIEFEALNRAFRSRTNDRQFCALGTAKMNIGHLDIASGVTGLINAVQLLEHEYIPPAIHFKSINPKIDLENSPFYVNPKLKAWPKGESPRRAGVSSFGVGGTNAHVVIEEAPSPCPRHMEKKARLIVLSGRTLSALDKATVNFAEHLGNHPEIDLDDVAFTLQVGRRSFKHRRIVVAETHEGMISAIESNDKIRVSTNSGEVQAPRVVMMFPGQGAQHLAMGRDLYQRFGEFRDDIDACAQQLIPLIDQDIRAAIDPASFDGSISALDLNETLLAQPAIFAIEYALARFWMRLGLVPSAMIGHSVGEVAAACVAGVFSLKDALVLISCRSRLMQNLPRGGMLSVMLSEAEIQPFLSESVSLAAVNSPQMTVVSGLESDLDHLQAEFERREIATKRLSATHAFHSHLMQPIVAPLADALKAITYHAPSIPYVSCVTGDWIKNEEAGDPSYWARHVVEPVRFVDALARLESLTGATYLEVGPGTTLRSLFARNRPGKTDSIALSSLRPAESHTSDLHVLLHSLGTLWLRGFAPDWSAIAPSHPRRVSLPTYPFERKRFWIDPPPPNADRPVNHPTNEVSSEIIMPETKALEADSSTKFDWIRRSLSSVLETLSGLKIDEEDHASHFLEMGFDSLFLTQVAQRLEAKFKLKLTFRQLLDRESSIIALARYIEKHSPVPCPDFAPEPVSREPASEPSTSLSDTNTIPRSMPEASITDSSLIHAIVREQLQAMSALMAKQLDAARGVDDAAPGRTIIAPRSPISEPSRQQKPADRASAERTLTTSNGFKAHGPFKPIQKGSLGELTPRQSEYLRALIDRYIAKTPRSKRYTQAHRNVLADPRVAAGFRSLWKEMVYPIVTVRSKGAYLWDIDGNRYIDILNGFGPIMFGHAPDFVVKALHDQIAEGYEIGPQTPLAGEVANLVCDLTGTERATFCNTGSEAVMAALRVARTVTGRNRIVLFAGAYHGTFEEVLVKAVPRGNTSATLPIAPGIPEESVSNVTVLPYGEAESLKYIETHAHELAAVLVEPVQSRRPALQPVEFLKAIRTITARSGTALIFDEVVTGFRVHPAGAQGMLGIRADLVTYGKVVGGGLPIGILAGSRSFMDALDGGFWQFGDDSVPEVGVTFFAGTFVRHPLALAATRAVLKHLKAEGPSLQEKLNDKTARFVHAINQDFEARDVPTRLEHFGSVFYFSFPPEQRFGSLIYYHLREQGVHIQEGFPCYLTTAHNENDIIAVIEAFRQSVDAMQRGGALPEPKGGIPPRSAIAVDAIQDRTFPITEAQNEIWLAARLSDEASCAFNEAFTLRFRGRLNRDALSRSLQRVVERHDAVRATFDPKQNLARIAAKLSLDVAWVDLGSDDSGEAQARLDRHLKANASLPFDLVNGPLIRASLVRLGDNDHVLVITSHHLVCDGWSTSILIDELRRFYRAEIEGSDLELPKAKPFKEYAEKERCWLDSIEYQETETWWTEQFREPVAPLELPLDLPRGALKSFNGATARHHVDPAAAQRLRRFGATQGCTLFATLLTGFKILLSRFSGQDDLVVGIPAAGQSLLDGETLVGHCVNFLPFRSSVNGEESVGSLMRRIKGSLLDAFDHQRYTYGSLLRQLALPRDPSRLPLVEVQFNLERLGAGLDFAGLTVEVDSAPKAHVNFDLFLNIVESNEGLRLDCDYNRDLFDHATIERWLGHYVTLLQGMATDPKRSIMDIPLLTPEEREELSRGWMGETPSHFQECCLHNALAWQAEKTPDATAVVFDGNTLSYKELDGQANSLAALLRSRGVGPGKRVAVCLERSLDMLVSLLAVLKAGGAYIPLDPNHPGERLEAILHDAEPLLLMTSPAVQSRLSRMETPVLSISEIKSRIASPTAHAPENLAVPEDLAYLIFTSGSTGKPKGVEITHRSLMNFLQSMAETPGMTSADAILALTTISFDIAALELWLPLMLGARVEMVAGDEAADGHRLVQRIDAAKVSMIQATPATWRLLLEAGWKGSPAVKALCGGEALPRDLADRILPLVGSLWNMYGPTETTVWSSVGKVQPGQGALSIGQPIANTQFLILDVLKNPVPRGIPGELHIGGAGLARGYWNQPTLTSERFLVNPFDPSRKSRLYATGDLVRCRTDGSIEFLGRIDSQVKVRGFRIETSEVELVLNRHSSIKECVVIVQDDPTGEKRLAAYYVPQGSSPSSAELRAFAANSLPAYMVPSIFVGVESIPKTTNRKVDRFGLPKDNAQSPADVSRHSVPLKPGEKQLLEICLNVLKLDALNVEDNLFDLGADSIQVFQIVARAQQVGITLTPIQVLKHRSIRAIVESGLEDRLIDEGLGAPPLVALSREQFRASIPI